MASVCPRYQLINRLTDIHKIFTFGISLGGHSSNSS